MSDFPPRVEKLRAMIERALPEADFLVEEVWKSTERPFGFDLNRFWRVSIQTDPDRAPTTIDVPDRLVLESAKAASLAVTRSASLILRGGVSS